MANPKKEFIGHVIIGIIISGVWLFWTNSVWRTLLFAAVWVIMLYIGSQSVDRLPEKKKEGEKE